MSHGGKTPPRVYLFFGGHHIHRRNLIRRLIEKARRQGGQEHLDLVVKDAAETTLQELYQEVLTLPFFAPRRLVVLKNLLTWVSAPAKKESRTRRAFLRLLEQVPPHTALVLDIAEDLKPDHWLLVWARSHPNHVYVRATPLPRGMGEMLRWMAQVLREEGGQATNEALATLYNLVGNDVQRAFQELQKLALYSQALGRPVTGEDVAALTLEGTPPNLFALGYALSGGRPEQAMRLLHRLLQREDARSLWSLLVRHFRLLLQVKALQEQGGDLYRWGREQRLPRFVVDRLSQQARLFSLDQLKSLYRRLTNLEDRFRRFEITPAEALESVVHMFVGAREP